MWIEVQRKNKKISSPISSPKMDERRQSPLRPLNPNVRCPEKIVHKRIRPPPGFPELENIEPTIRPREPDIWTDHKVNQIANWRDKNVR